MVLFHGTTISGCRGIARSRAVKGDKKFNVAYFQASRQPKSVSDLVEVVNSRVDGHGHNIAKIVWECKADLPHGTLRGGGTQAECKMIGEGTFPAVHMNCSSANRWAVDADYLKVSGMWVHQTDALNGFDVALPYMEI